MKGNHLITKMKTSFHSSQSGCWLNIYYQDVKVYEISGKPTKDFRGRFCVKASSLPKSVKEYINEQIELFNLRIGRGG